LFKIVLNYHYVALRFSFIAVVTQLPNTAMIGKWCPETIRLELPLSFELGAYVSLLYIHSSENVIFVSKFSKNLCLSIIKEEIQNVKVNSVSEIFLAWR
jgi:hypothetical protein